VADVFLSYAREDHEAAGRIAACLEQRGWTVWWDCVIVPGQSCHDVIESELSQARCVVVLWSSHSVSSDWVKNEASDGSKRGALVPATLDNVKIPLAFRHVQAANLTGWSGDSSHPELRILADGVAAVLSSMPLAAEKAGFPPPAPPGQRPCQVGPPCLPRINAETLVGRGQELALLRAAWQAALGGTTPRARIITLVAWGGVGKTALVGRWMAELAAQGWQGAERVFEWSFYSQGTREQGGASADTFVKEALTFFGDAEMAGSSASARDKGLRLAALVGQGRSLLVLDGIEPLQRPAPQVGELTDEALAALLMGLALGAGGALCVVTTRESVADLMRFHGTTVRECALDNLSEEAGAELLRKLEVRGTEPERRKLSRDVGGHALTLELVGSYIVRACQSDIRSRDQVRLKEADKAVQGGHAFKVMATYETWLSTAGKDGTRQLALLQILGLFDRPADPECLRALCRAPAITGLTEPLVELGKSDWNLVVSNLEKARLVKRLRYRPIRVMGFSEGEAERPQAERGEPHGFERPDRLGPEDADVLDMHPLLREYFGLRVREKSLDAYREGHFRLYEHLTRSVPYWPEAIEGLGPLFQAMAHGCLAGRFQEVLEDVYVTRLARWKPGSSGADNHYAARVLGAWSATLASLAGFFDRPWEALGAALQGRSRELLLQQAGWLLRSTGRFPEATRLLNQSRIEAEDSQNWHVAGTTCRNLNQILEATGELEQAVHFGRESVRFAELARGDVAKNRTRLAGTYHMLGDLAMAETLLREAGITAELAEAQNTRTNGYEYFLLGDLLVSQGKYDDAMRSADMALEVANPAAAPIVPALAYLVRGRAELLREYPPKRENLEVAERHFDACMEKLHKNGEIHQLPRGLLALAKCRRLAKAWTRSREDCEEALEISTRSYMSLWEEECRLESLRWDLDRLRDSCVEKRTRAPECHTDELRKRLTDVRDSLDRMKYGRLLEECDLAEVHLVLLEHQVGIRSDYPQVMPTPGGFACHASEWEYVKREMEARGSRCYRSPKT
jgi:tetratricopeptide (TPR) repeat protein